MTSTTISALRESLEGAEAARKEAVRLQEIARELARKVKDFPLQALT